MGEEARADEPEGACWGEDERLAAGDVFAPQRLAYWPEGRLACRDQMSCRGAYRLDHNPVDHCSGE